MARLNEPVVPTESIESLKRRFFRQNRDLARCNSSQSLRIRHLESDVSALLSENATLRQQIIHLDAEVREQTRVRDLCGNVDTIHSKLQDKVGEFTALLQQLNKVSAGARVQKPARSPKSPLRSPERKEWRNRRELSEVLQQRREEEAEWRLPTIAEGKRYPRRSTEARELERLLQVEISEGRPDADVDRKLSGETDALTRSEGSREPPSESAAPGVDDDTPVLLSSNLETRRRRRETKIHFDDQSAKTTTSAQYGSPEKEKTRTMENLSLQSQPLRAGAKRKFGNRDAKDTTSTSPKGAIGNSASANLQSSPVRRPLSTKPVNTDPVISPRKMVTSGVTSKPPVSRRIDEAKPTRKPIERQDIQREKIVQKSVQLALEQDRRLKTEEEEQEKAHSVAPDGAEYPTTPAALDIFSPPSTLTHPSSDSQLTMGRAGTPPPSDLHSNASSAGGTGTMNDIANGRGSLRRGRAAVSYAEPKLNVKMRRPGKEMVDAVMSSQTGSSCGRVSEGHSRTLSTDSKAETEPVDTAITHDASQPHLSERTAGSGRNALSTDARTVSNDANDSDDHSKPTRTVHLHGRRNSATNITSMPSQSRSGQDPASPLSSKRPARLSSAPNLHTSSKPKEASTSETLGTVSSTRAGLTARNPLNEDLSVFDAPGDSPPAPSVKAVPGLGTARSSTSRESLLGKDAKDTGLRRDLHSSTPSGSAAGAAGRTPGPYTSSSAVSTKGLQRRQTLSTGTAAGPGTGGAGVNGTLKSVRVGTSTAVPPSKGGTSARSGSIGTVRVRSQEEEIETEQVGEVASGRAGSLRGRRRTVV